MRRFIIASMSRSGSTTLAKMINIAKPSCCLVEPFNREVTSEYGAPSDQESLMASLKLIYGDRGYAGIKHVFHATGWPFPNKSNLNFLLLSWNGAKVVFIRRANALERILSQMIAEQTDLWEISNERDYKNRSSVQLAPIDPNRIEWHLKIDQAFTVNIRACLEARGSDSMEVTYEEMFGARSLNQKIASLSSVFSFLGLQTPPENYWKADDVKKLLIERGEFTSSREYDKIPNWAQICTRFGRNPNWP